MVAFRELLDGGELCLRVRLAAELAVGFGKILSRLEVGGGELARFLKERHRFFDFSALEPDDPETVPGDSRIQVCGDGALEERDRLVAPSTPVEKHTFSFALNGLHGDGSRLPDFPRPTKDIGASATGTPAVADVDGDGLLEIAWLDSGKRLYLWDLDAPASSSRPWPMVRADAGHRGRIASADPLRIEGRVLDRTGRGVPGVWVSVTGTVSRGTSTDADGGHALTPLVAGGDYTVTPSRSGLTFTPPSVTLSNLQDSVLQDFQAEGEGGIVSLELTVTGFESGEGVVFLDPPATYCSNAASDPVVSCPQTFPPDTIVTALATPAPGSKFLGWARACQGTGPCQVPMIADTQLDAKFLGPQELLVVLDGFENGQGTVGIDPPGAICDLSGGSPTEFCSHFLPPDTVVTLTAMPAPDSKFLGWQDDSKWWISASKFIYNAPRYLRDFRSCSRHDREQPRRDRAI